MNQLSTKWFVVETMGAEALGSQVSQPLSLQRSLLCVVTLPCNGVILYSKDRQPADNTAQLRIAIPRTHVMSTISLRSAALQNTNRLAPNENLLLV